MAQSASEFRLQAAQSASELRTQAAQSAIKDELQAAQSASELRIQAAQSASELCFGEIINLNSYKLQGAMCPAFVTILAVFYDLHSPGGCSVWRSGARCLSSGWKARSVPQGGR